MATNIGPKIGIDGEQQYKKEMANIIQQAKTLDSQMKLLTSSFSSNTTAEEKNAKTAGVAGAQYLNQKKQVELLRDQLKKATDAYGENDTRTLKLKESLNKATTKLNDMTKAEQTGVSKTDNLTDSVEDVSEGFNDAGQSGLKFGDILKANVISDVIINGMKKVGDAALEIGKAVVGFVKDAVVAFAELQQNLGGSEAVFGEYASTVQKTAEDAYKTMGTTQSQYLATANKMGALFQGSGLDAQRSMELTTQAMQRAADMASVMGIDTESALEAVSGAAKGNYTMMDNLGVAMNATTLDAYAMSKGFDKAFSKMTNAEKAEVAMQYFFENTSQYAGNFEREASETVSGSIGMLQSAVQTWVAGLGNSEADIVKLTNNIIEAFQAAVENIVPVVENIVGALPEIVGAVVPAIMEILPSVLDAAVEIITTLVDGLMKALPQLAREVPKVIFKLVEFMLGELPLILDTAFQIIVTLANGITAVLPTLIPAIVKTVMKIVEVMIQNLPLIWGAAMELIKGLAAGIIDALPILLGELPPLVVELVNTLLDMIPQIIDCGTELLGALIDNSDVILDTWANALPDMILGLINALVNNAPKIAEAGYRLFVALVEKMPALIENYIAAFKTCWGTLIQNIISQAPTWAAKGKELLESVFSKWKDIFSRVGSTLMGYGKQLIQGLWNGMKNAKDWLWNKVRSMLSSLTDKIKSFFGIHSPSKLFEDEIGENLAKGIGVGFKAEMPDVTKTMNGAMPTALNTTNFGGVTITVNGAPGQNVNDLADAVAQRINNMVGRRNAVYA